MVCEQQSYEVRSRTQTVLMAADVPVVDRELLGERGIVLCRDVPVFLAHRLNANYNSYNSMTPCLSFQRSSIAVFYNYVDFSSSKLNVVQ